MINFVKLNMKHANKKAILYTKNAHDLTYKLIILNQIQFTEMQNPMYSGNQLRIKSRLDYVYVCAFS